MQARRATTTTVVTLLAAAGALAVASGAASCAASGAGENENFTDSATVSDGTMGNDTGGDSQVTGEAGPGCDADTMNNLDNCGSCGHKCGSGQTCSCGMCQNFCQNGLTACCGSCVDVTKDTNNCGQCGNQCLPPAGSGPGSVQGIPHCVASTCTFTCPTTGPEGGTILTCNADAGIPGCYDPTASANACGGCGKPCATGQDCLDTMCCASGDLICGGKCTPVQTDPHNCGACDAGCGAGDASTCMNGKCVGYSVTYPTEAFVDACSLPGATTVLQSSNSGWDYTHALITFPGSFSFPFFGTPQTQFWLQNQGTMGIGPDMVPFFSIPDNYPDCTPGNADPTVGYPAAVAFGNAQMGTGPLGVCYASIGGSAVDGGGEGGTAATQFVVTWKQATLFTDPGGLIDVSIVLTAATGNIDFQYQMADGADGGLDPAVAGANTTVGLQQGNGSMVTAPASCDMVFITSSPFAIRFTP